MRKLIIASSVLLIAAACGSQVVLFPNDAGILSEAGINDASQDSVNDVFADASQDVLTQDVLVEASQDVLAETQIESSLDAPPDVPVVSCTPTPGSSVNLGTAGTFAILAKSGISTVPASAITGNIGVSPIAATAITGFSLTPCSGTCASSTSTQVTGQVFAADYGAPTPTNMTTAVSDMQTAFTDAAGRAPSSAATTELGSGDISGMTLAPGVYKWSTGLLMTTNVTLSGSCSDVWIFEVAQNMTVNSGVHVVLSGGATPDHVFWQVSGATSLGTTVHFNGTILDQTAIALNTGATINGRLLAQTAVTLNQNVVTQP
jgi:hypothetical protein